MSQTVPFPGDSGTSVRKRWAKKECSLDSSSQDQSRPCATPPTTHTQPSFRGSKSCTRVGHQIQPSEMHAPKGGIAHESALQDVSKYGASGETRR